MKDVESRLGPSFFGFTAYADYDDGEDSCTVRISDLEPRHLFTVQRLDPATRETLETFDIRSDDNALWEFPADPAFEYLFMDPAGFDAIHRSEGGAVPVIVVRVLDC